VEGNSINSLNGNGSSEHAEFLHVLKILLVIQLVTILLLFEHYGWRGRCKQNTLCASAGVLEKTPSGDRALPGSDILLMT